MYCYYHWGKASWVRASGFGIVMLFHLVFHGVRVRVSFGLSSGELKKSFGREVKRLQDHRVQSNYPDSACSTSRWHGWLTAFAIILLLIVHIILLKFVSMLSLVGVETSFKSLKFQILVVIYGTCLPHNMPCPCCPVTITLLAWYKLWIKMNHMTQWNSNCGAIFQKNVGNKCVPFPLFTIILSHSKSAARAS